MASRSRAGESPAQERRRAWWREAEPAGDWHEELFVDTRTREIIRISCGCEFGITHNFRGGDPFAKRDRADT